ncbi:MAG: hypothetical protein EXR98_00955 [Gemmataceae bacterium]|nr:hypothetical protein [Gemmataceae bacterium]
MRHLSANSRDVRRPGMVLLVVMALLALFSSVALGFVFYADAEAVAARANNESMAKDQPDIDTELLAAYFLNQLMYPTDNIYSAMRGWDLARSMHGYNPTTLNYTPYNGTGRISLMYPDITFPVDNFTMVNYTTYWDRTSASPGVNFVRTPEYTDKVPFLPAGGPPSPTHLAAGGPTYRYVGGSNPPWTAYDTNSLFLAEMTADGYVRRPSFIRPWMQGNIPGSDANKYMSLRPDVGWHPAFVTPDNEFVPGPVPGTGYHLDVRNNDAGRGALINGVPYQNDSTLMDLGFPVKTAPNGRRFKPLFAPLIVDLSNRLHLWAHHNRIGAGAAHVSNQGLGAPEVNLGKLPGAVAAELQALLNLRYGGVVGGPGSLPAGSPTRFPNAANVSWFANLDADGRNSATGGYSNRPLTAWAIVVGMSLVIDAGSASQETVGVTGVGPGNTFTANFANAHGAGATVNGTNSGGFPFATNATAGVGAGVGPMAVSAVVFNTVFPFPSYPAGYDNAYNGGGGADEVTQKPLGINIYNLTGLTAQGPIGAAHLESLMRWGGTNSPALTSEIFRRMPGTLSNVRTRNMVTLHNRHLDRVTASPLLPWNPITAGNYTMGPTAAFPTFNPASAAINPPAAGSEFNADGRSELGKMLRVNLNRPLADYPAATVVPVAAEPNSKLIDTGNAGVVAAFNNAQNARGQFARDIYGALVRVTGAQDPNNPAVTVVLGSPDYVAARWLAQLAVNIVDYIDNDDYSTPFVWYGGDIVFGTETPRLVLNEVYAQHDNDPATVVAAVATTSRLNIWLELHNPFQGTPAGSTYPLDDGSAKLQIGANAVYQIVVCRRNDPALAVNLRNPANHKGDPEFNNTSGVPYTLSTSSSWGTTAVQHEVLPAGGAASGAAGSNAGYYVAGSNQAAYLPMRNPNLATTSTSGELSIVGAPDAPAIPVTLLLRRLAIPHLPPQPTAALPLYNPYITVDYLDNIAAGDNREFPIAQPLPTTRNSLGRKQPYAAYNNPGALFLSQVVPQTPAVATQPFNTFYSRNTPDDAPYTWLTHLDRPLINQLELLHVSAFKPHELTQQFIVPVGAGPTVTKFQHSLIGNGNLLGNPATLLYRMLEVLGTPNNMLGAVPGGLMHGNININTMTELEIWQSLCDAQAQPYSAFNQADVNATFLNILAARNAGGAFAGEGTPFRSFASGSPTTNPLANPAVFAPPSLFASTGSPHPYATASILQKAYNNIGSTSNTFAVWWTVGFFEVVDESVRPARLGAEIGRDQNRHIRHRFFAIVDRTGLQLFNTTVTANLQNPNFPADQRTLAGANQPMFSSFSGQLKSGQTWDIRPGMLLEVDSGTSQEVVAVKTVDAVNKYFTADFTLNHNPGVPIICRGNPGPRVNPTGPAGPPYNPRQDSGVVLHLSVIQ